MFQEGAGPVISPAFSALLKHDKVTFTFEAIGDGKVRVADQTPVHEADKRRAKAYRDAQISIADYAIMTLQDHVAN